MRALRLASAVIAALSALPAAAGEPVHVLDHPAMVLRTEVAGTRLTAWYEPDGTALRLSVVVIPAGALFGDHHALLLTEGAVRHLPLGPGAGTVTLTRDGAAVRFGTDAEDALVAAAD